MTNNVKFIKADPEFVENELDDIIDERRKTGKDKKNKSYRRLTAAIRRHPLWQTIKRDIIADELKENRQGQTEVLTWLVVGFITVIFLAVFVYGFGLLTNSLITVPTQSGVNITEAATETFVPINNALSSGVATLGFIIIFMTALSILISNFFIREHPIAFIIHIFVTILAVVIAAPVANAYSDLLTGQPFSGNLVAMKAASSIMLHLPTWVAVIGIFGAIILFVRVTRTRSDFE